MHIYTSSWFSALPDTIQKIGVSRGTPRGYPKGFRRLGELAPGPWFHSVSAVEYTRLYMEQLGKLDAATIVRRIEEMAAGKDAALLCFEAPHKPDDWCHRGHVSAWLKERLGLDVFEYGYEGVGCGWSHPKVPGQFRTAPGPTPLDVTNYLGRRATDRQGRTWEVLGRSSAHPNQAEVKDIDSGEVRMISGEILEERFGDAPRLL